jgi:hypothetical protein
MSGRRGSYDPLQSVDQPTWLVITDMTGGVLSCLQFARRTGLRARFSEAITAAASTGWVVENHPPGSGSVFVVTATGTECKHAINRVVPGRA